MPNIKLLINFVIMLNIKMKKEEEVLKKFNLSPNDTVFLDNFRCFSNSAKIPTLGKLYVFNNSVCFSTKLDMNVFLGNSCKLKILMKDVVLVELEQKV